MFISQFAFGGTNEPTEKIKPVCKSEATLKFIRGHFKYIGSSKYAYAFRCEAPFDKICCYYKSSVSSEINIDEGCLSLVEDITLQVVFDETKMYIGIPDENGLHFYEQGSITTNCETDGLTIEFDNGIPIP